MNKKLLGIIIGVVVLLGAVGVYFFYFRENIKTDAVRFASEYTSVLEDNIFVYRNPKEIINILENGTGIVYMGFPECPWCQAYVPYLNEVATNEGIEKIYYLNVLEIRKNNTPEYQKIVSILSDYLLNNDEGNKRVYVPDVTVVKNGEIVGHDNETSVVSEEDGTPADYWTSEKTNNLKSKLENMIKPIVETTCTTCER